MERINKTLRFFNDYLKGNNKVTLATYLKHVYGRQFADIYNDFHTININDNDEIYDQIQEILKNSNIEEKKQQRFQRANITLYEFLIELQQISYERNGQVNEFVRLIKESDTTKETIASLASVGAIVTLSLSPIAILNLNVVQSLVNATLFFPVVGLVYTIGVGLYSIYQGLRDKKTQVMQRFTDNFFLFASAALNVAAYSVLIAAAVSVNPIAAILFVAASAVNVVKESFNLIKLTFFDKKKEINADDSLASKVQHARLECESQKTKNNLLIELGAATAMLGVIAAWSFIPGGIFLSIASVAAIGLVFLGKKLLSSYNEKRSTTQLENTIDLLEAQYVLDSKVSALGKVAAPDHEVELQSVPTPKPDRHPNGGGRASEGGMFATSRENRERSEHKVESLVDVALVDDDPAPKDENSSLIARK